MTPSPVKRGSQLSILRAVVATAAGVKPKWANAWGAGADTPYSVMPWIFNFDGKSDKLIHGNGDAASKTSSGLFGGMTLRRADSFCILNNSRHGTDATAALTPFADNNFCDSKAKATSEPDAAMVMSADDTPPLMT